MFSGSDPSAPRRALSLRIRLCRQGDEFVYVVTTMKRDGRVARVTLDGASGKVADIR